MMNIRSISLLLILLASLTNATSQVKDPKRNGAEMDSLRRVMTGVSLPPGYWYNTSREGIFNDRNRLYLISTVNEKVSGSLELISQLRSIKKQMPNLEVFLIYMTQDEVNQEDLNNFIIRNDIAFPIYVTDPKRKPEIAHFDTLLQTMMIKTDFSFAFEHFGSDFLERKGEELSTIYQFFNELKVSKLQSTGQHDGMIRYERPVSVINRPIAVCDDGEGGMFVRTSPARQILRINGAGEVVAAYGNGGADFSDGEELTCTLGTHGDMAFDKAAGKLYIADPEFHRIRELNVKSGKLSTLAGDGRFGVSLGKEIEKVERSAINSPTSLFVAEGQLFFALTDEHEIWKLELGSGEAERILGNGTRGAVDGKAKKALLDTPVSLVSDGAKGFYFTERSGKLRHWTGKKLESPDLKGVPEGPHSLVMNGDTLLIICRDQHQILSYHPKSGLNTFSGSGRGYTDGLASKVQYNCLADGFIRDGLLYLADEVNQTIRALDLDARSTETVQLSNIDLIMDRQLTVTGPNGIIYLDEVKLIPGTNYLRVDLDLPENVIITPDTYRSVSIVDTEFDQIVDKDLGLGEVLFEVEGRADNVHLTFEISFEYTLKESPLVRYYRTTRVFVPFSMAEEGEVKDDTHFLKCKALDF